VAQAARIHSIASFTIRRSANLSRLFLPLEEVKKCREQLEPNADLKLYTTTIAADDMDEVRAALGYEQLNLFGGSYGTRAALTYLKRHPKHVRTATLQGIAPIRSIHALRFSSCRRACASGRSLGVSRRQECSEAFPNIKDEAKSVLAELIKGPVEVEIQKPNSSER
jgi:pimeloyl-ACP methyl ester carboxylesterase